MRTLYVSERSLYSMRSVILSQWRERKTDVIGVNLLCLWHQSGGIKRRCCLSVCPTVPVCPMLTAQKRWYRILIGNPMP